MLELGTPACLFYAVLCTTWKNVHNIEAVEVRGIEPRSKEKCVSVSTLLRTS